MLVMCDSDTIEYYGYYFLLSYHYCNALPRYLFGLDSKVYNLKILFEGKRLYND